MTNHKDDSSSEKHESGCRSNSDDDSSEGSREISALEGLSASSLAALVQFQECGFFPKDTNDEAEEEESKISKETLCVAYTEKDTQVIADTMKRLQLKTEEASLKSKEILDNRTVLDLQPTEGSDGVDSSSFSKAEAAATVLKDDGVVRINKVLSSSLASSCLEKIQHIFEMGGHVNDLDDNDRETSGFGNVFSRENRYDMYLRNEGVFNDALHSLFENGSILGSLFDILFDGRSGVFHEFSALISDPGSACQPIHPDSTFTETAQLFTCFIALQDITQEMGPTTFLPRTHTRSCHESHQATDGSRYEFLASCEYRQSLLGRGDVAIMDSRTMHYGGANISDGHGFTNEQRALMYFTIRNPLHSETGMEEDYMPNGSIWPDLHMTTHEFL
jgi:hypothetical protein